MPHAVCRIEEDGCLQIIKAGKTPEEAMFNAYRDNAIIRSDGLVLGYGAWERMKFREDD